MNNFEIDFEDEPSNNSNIINSRLANSSTHKYAANTFTRGFFNEEEELYESPSRLQPLLEAKGDQSPSKGKELQRKRRSRKIPGRLEPLKPSETVSVFDNYVRPGSRAEDEIQDYSLQPIRRQENKPEIIKRQENSRHEAQNYPEQITLPKPNTLVFQEEDEALQQQPEQLPRANRQHPLYLQQHQHQVDVDEGNQVSIAQNRQFRHVFEEESDNDTVQVQAEVETNLVGPEYFTYSSQESLKRQFQTQIREGNLLRMQVIRDRSGFNTFWPQFHMHFSENSHYLMSAKKTSSKPSSTFIFSCKKDDFQQKSPNYLGKMKSNVMGDMLNIFGPGLNPSNAKDRNQVPRELLATIVYSTAIFQLGRPRQFFVYVKKPEYRYYNHFAQVRMYQEQIPLSSLYELPDNRNKIVIYRNRKPQWMQNLGGYMLNFRGRVECASIKNFILQKDQNGPEIMLFGKVNEAKFNLDMGHPIAPLVAFGVALSSFDSRIMCE